MFAFVNNHAVAQVALGFGRLFAHQVTHPSAIALYFPLASHRKTLLGAGVGLHFRHDKNICLKNGAQKYDSLAKDKRKV